MDKSIQIQHQVRENAEEIEDYIKDLVNWEKEMKRKEEEIKKLTHEEPVLPPIRSAQQSSIKKKKTKENEQSGAAKGKPKKSKEKKGPKNAARIPGYDYRAWDLFNVDKALEEVDEKGESKKSSSEEEEEGGSEDSEGEMHELERKMQLALIEKDKGNQFFKKGDYDMAILCYTSGIEHDPSNALLPANRAMALLKKGQLAAAETDCTQCLVLDPTYIKAYLRRGTARIGLKKYEEAKQDFSKVLELDPDNNQAKLELQRLQKEMSLSKSKIDVDSTENEKVGNKVLEVSESNVVPSAPTETESKTISSSLQHSDIYYNQLLKPEDKDSCVMKAIQKPPHLRSQKPMKKITIKDVSGIAECDVPAFEEKHSPVTRSVQEEVISLEKGEKPAITVISTVDEQLEQLEDPNERVSAASVDQIHSDHPSMSHHEKTEAIMSVHSILPSLPPIPSTSYQFLGDWKKLKHYPELLYEYIKQFPPERLPAVFKQSIDTELFCDILQVLSTKFVENNEDVFFYLQYLRNVGRFKTLVMFLAEEDIAALNRLFQFVKSSQKYPLEEIQNVEKDYELS